MIEIFISNQEVWWNRGVEVKPSREAFGRFTFEKVNNFNISWVDELHINVIVPNNKKATLIKIIDPNDDDGVTVKYYYLMEVLNKTSKNKECIYQLDIWLTYILNSDILGSSGLRTIKSIKTLDPNNIPPTINVIPTGVPTGKVELITKSYPYYKIDGLNAGAPNIFPKPKETGIVPGVTTNIYFVFRTKPIHKRVDWPYGVFDVDKKYTTRRSDYILIPLLNAINIRMVKRINIYKHLLVSGSPKWEFYKSGSFSVYNRAAYLMTLVEESSKHGESNGLGDFIGIWVGPNYFRINNNDNRIKAFPTFKKFIDNRDITFETNDIVLSYNDNTNSGDIMLALRIDANGVNLKPLDNYTHEEMLKNYNYLENSNNNILKNIDRVYFNNCFSFSNGVSSIDIDIQLPSVNDNYFNILNQQKATRNTSLAISGVNAILGGVGGLIGIIPPPPTEAITTTNYTNTKDVDTVTTTGPQSWTKYNEKHQLGAIRDKTIDRIWGVDSFGKRDILLRSVATYDREPSRILNLKSSNEKAAFDRANRGTITNSGTRSVTRSGNRSVGVSGMLGAGLGVLRGGLQFASTLAQQEAYKKDLRTSTSNTYNNVNNLYNNWMTLSQKVKPLTVAESESWTSVDDFYNSVNKEVIYGATTIPGKLPYFYGYDTTPTPIGGDVNGITNEAYILIDELTKLNLEVSLSNRYSPTIKSSIITLLTNGIRMTSSPSIFSYFDLGDNDEKETT